MTQRTQAALAGGVPLEAFAHTTRSAAGTLLFG
jgi:hypothetical protein